MTEYSAKRLALLVICALLLVLCVYAWREVLKEEESVLRVSILDVGQGDAIFIESPSGTQVLVDGGRDRSVLRQLSREMGLFDRSIDLVIATHPDADHVAGLPGVFARYEVSRYVGFGVEGDTAQAAALGAAIEAEGIEPMDARRGMRLNLGEGVYLDVLYPDRDAPLLETNAGSVVARLTYGETSFMFTGDAPMAIEEWLVSLDGEALQSDVLKAGHHGSKTSTSEAWLNAVNPAFVAISAGKDNAYGHPAEDVLERIRKSGAEVRSTIEEGTIRFVSDGETVTVQ